MIHLGGNRNPRLPFVGKFIAADAVTQAITHYQEIVTHKIDLDGIVVLDSIEDATGDIRKYGWRFE